MQQGAVGLGFRLVHMGTVYQRTYVAPQHKVQRIETRTGFTPLSLQPDCSKSPIFNNNRINVGMEGRCIPSPQNPRWKLWRTALLCRHVSLKVSHNS